MTVPTPDEQALTEQIAEKLHSDFWGSRHSVEQVKEWWSELPTLAPSAYTGYIRTARAVLPIVKAAQRDALTAFIAACEEKRDNTSFLLPANYFEDIDATIRVARSYIRNYFEETR